MASFLPKIPTAPPASTMPLIKELHNIPVPPVTTITLPANENLFSNF